ncbi:MAG: hypothetical protein JWP32_1196 [Schumannella sp.]|nr:hypothetical protein [Schumannella sp.]
MSERVEGPPPMPWLPYPPDGQPVDPALGGRLRVTPGARAGEPVVVVTDALLAHAERLTVLREGLAADARALGGAAWLAADQIALAPPVARRGERELAAAHHLTREAAEIARRADEALRLAIGGYSRAEAQRQAEMIAAGAAIAQLLGPTLRVVLVLGLPAVLAAHAAGLPTPEQVTLLREWMLQHPELITDPAFVEAVRAGVMSIDDGAGSMLGLPPGVVALIAAGAGFTGVEVGAGIVLAGAQPFGLLREGPVSVERISTTSLTAGPRGCVERLARVPENDQVRIERYDAPGEPPRFIVYVGPTETFSPVATDEPWDLTSNVTGVAGLSSGSIRATESAMHDAGVQPGDAVQFVGFSQGGLVATRLAASGEWNSAGLETYGAPAGGISLPAGLDGMAIRNSDDFIPALAGPQTDHHLLQVERRAFEPGSPIPTELPAPAHQRSAYVATATEVDRAESSAVRQQIAAMDEFTSDYTQREGSTVTVLTYHAERGAVKALGQHAGPPQEPAAIGRGGWSR